LRRYSTAAFASINNPLREAKRTSAHPFAVTIFYLAEGIKRLRTVEACRAESQEVSRKCVDLWRGMKHVQAAEDFLASGGTEAGLMSTTSELGVAVAYGASAHSLVFKIHTESFMQRGADISFLSCFPAEAEFLCAGEAALEATDARSHTSREGVACGSSATR
jgi:hypothetical protein